MTLPHIDEGLLHRPEELQAVFTEIEERVGQFILGKQTQIQLSLCCLLAEGHLLIEDIPGIGKTTLAKVLARILGLEFHRIQCTSDMLPGDILGVSIFNQQSSSFSLHKGPIFTQILLADEINRTTPKTQSALLEAMEEQQVSIEGETHVLPSPFFVIATQNPLEQAGTYPLPESQLDRFLLRISLGYPDRDAEQQLLAAGGISESDTVSAVLDPKYVLQLQRLASQVHLAPPLIEYIQDLLEFSRNCGKFSLGLSPRAGLSLVRASRALALLHGRDYCLPEDVQKILPHVGVHRLRRVDTLAEMSFTEITELFSVVELPV